MRKITLLLITILTIGGCYTYDSSNYVSSQEYQERERNKRSKECLEKALYYFNIQNYDSAKFYAREVSPSTKYFEPADSLYNKIDFILYQPTLDKILFLSDLHNYDELYVALKDNMDLMRAYKRDIYDSVVYFHATNFLMQENAEYLEKFMPLLHWNSPYRDKILFSAEFKEYNEKSKIIGKQKRDDEKYQKDLASLEYAKLIIAEAESRINFYNNKLNGMSLTNIREYLYDQGFSRRFTSGGEVYSNSYFFENGDFYLTIDVWFSYGYKRLFYEVSVSTIHFTDGDGKQRTYFPESGLLL